MDFFANGQYFMIYFSNKQKGHFHCIRCNFSFVEYTAMAEHESTKHSSILEQEITKPKERSLTPNSVPDSQENKVVKSSGTFYPLSAFSPNRTGKVVNFTKSPSPDITRNPSYEEKGKTPVYYSMF